MPSPSSYIDSVLRNRFLGFLIWQSIQSTVIFLLSKSLLLSPFTPNPFIPSLSSLLSFLLFHLSMLLFSLSIHAISAPQPRRPASVVELGLRLLRLVFAASSPLEGGFRSRARVSLGLVIIVAAGAASGCLAVVSLVWGSFRGGFGELVGEVGSRGFVVGFVYGLCFFFKQRWVLVFPVIQRPAFFSYKMGIPSAIRQSLRLSIGTYLLSSLLVLFLPHQSRSQLAGWPYFSQNIVFYIGSLVVILCWELIQHLHKVLHTKRFMFAPPKGSAAAETNPSEPLIAALEESPPRSLLQYLAYLDLNMICGSDIDTWRRAAFFEETGETYRKIIDSLLRPLEQLACKLSEGLASSVSNISNQLCSPDDVCQNPEIVESFSDFQVYTWCAQVAASLMAHSHKEDRFGVAQLSGSHAAVLSNLLSCLLAVEALMGKKTNLQTPKHMLGPAGIRWATNSLARREITMMVNKKKDSPLYLKAFSLADVLKISIYRIVAEFLDEMLSSAKEGLLEKDWLASREKPIYGSHDVLVQKLQLFLGFQAS